MPTITDFLFSASASGAISAIPGVFVRVVNNSTAASFVGNNPTTSAGAFTIANVTAGQYTIFTGPTATGPWSQTADTNYTVGVSPGDNPNFPAPLIVSGTTASSIAAGITVSNAVSGGNTIQFEADNAANGQNASAGLLLRQTAAAQPLAGFEIWQTLSQRTAATGVASATRYVIQRQAADNSSMLVYFMIDELGYMWLEAPGAPVTGSPPVNIPGLKINPHLYFTGTSPTITNVNAGISGTPSVNFGNNAAGSITFTTTGSPPALNASLFTVNFNSAFDFTPIVLVRPQTAPTAAVVDLVVTSVSVASFIVVSNCTLAATTSYTIGYFAVSHG